MWSKEVIHYTIKEYLKSQGLDQREVTELDECVMMAGIICSAVSAAMEMGLNEIVSGIHALGYSKAEDGWDANNLVMHTAVGDFHVIVHKMDESEGDGHG